MCWPRQIVFLKVVKWCIDLEQLGGWVYFDSKVVSFDYTQIVDKVPYSDKKIFCNGCCQGNVRNNKVGNPHFLKKKKKKKKKERRKRKEKKKWVSVYRSFLEWLQSPIRHFTKKIRQIPRTLYRVVGMKIFNRQAVCLHWWRYSFFGGGGCGGGGEEVMGNLRSRFLYFLDLERELLRLHSWTDACDV